jgi:hypothetical protein
MQAQHIQVFESVIWMDGIVRFRCGPLGKYGVFADVEDLDVIRN